MEPATVALAAAAAAKLASNLFGSGYSEEHKQAKKDIQKEKREAFSENLGYTGKMSDAYSADKFNEAQLANEARIKEELEGLVAEQNLYNPMAGTQRGRTQSAYEGAASESFEDTLKDLDSQAILNSISGAFDDTRDITRDIMTEKDLYNLGSGMRVANLSKWLQSQPSRNKIGQILDPVASIFGTAGQVGYMDSAKQEVMDYLGKMKGQQGFNDYMAELG